MYNRTTMSSQILEQKVFEKIYQSKYIDNYFSIDDKIQISKMLGELHDEERLFTDREIMSFYNKYINDHQLTPSHRKDRVKALNKRIKCSIVDKFYVCHKLLKRLSLKTRIVCQQNSLIEINHKLHSAGAMFFTDKNKKIFLKGMDCFGTYLNEKKALELLNPNNDNPRFLKHYESPCDETVAMEFTDWKPLDRYGAIKNELDFLNFLIKTLQDLRKNDIIHRDFMPQNILVSGGKTPNYKLFDFGFAIVPGVEIPKRHRRLRRFIERNLGYPMKPYERVWDDAYSALLTAEKYIPELYQKYPKQVKKIINLSEMEQLHGF